MSKVQAVKSFGFLSYFLFSVWMSMKFYKYDSIIVIKCLNICHLNGKSFAECMKFLRASWHINCSEVKIARALKGSLSQVSWNIKCLVVR